MFDLFWWHALIQLAGGFLIFVGAVFPLTRRGQVLTRACLVLVLLGGVYGYTNFGRLHGGRVYHYTEQYLYYMGSKYYQEVSHRYLYVAFVGAFAELDGPVPEVREIRDLEHPFHKLNAAEAHYLFLREVRPRFSTARWNQFKDDVRGFLRGPWTPGDWGLGDVGYNPPPTYAVVARFIANRIALTPQALSLTPFIDWVLVALAGLVVFRTFGFFSAAGYYLIFLTNDLASLHWVGGAFCRMLWFVALTLALCALHRRRYLLAGLGFGFAIGMRIFPFVFFFGALVPLAWEAVRSWRGKAGPKGNPLTPALLALEGERENSRLACGEAGPLRQFGPTLRPIGGLLLGCGLMLALLGGLSLIHFTPGHWRDFADKIGVHGKTFFTMHLGYDKVATATWNKGPQYFSDLANFESWNVRLNDLFNTHWPLHRFIALLFVGAALLASLRSPPWLSSLLMGETIMFFYTLPANYYYIYLALFFAVLVYCAGIVQSPSSSAKATEDKRSKVQSPELAAPERSEGGSTVQGPLPGPFHEPGAQEPPLTPALSPYEGEIENGGPPGVESVHGPKAGAEHVMGPWPSGTRYWLLLLFLVWCNLAGGFSNDWIVLNGWINLALLGLLIFYTGSMLWENAVWRSRLALGCVACALVPLALITFKPRTINITSRQPDYVQLSLFSPAQRIYGGRGWMQHMTSFGSGWLAGEQLAVEAGANTAVIGSLANPDAGPYELELNYTAAPDYARASLNLLDKEYVLATVAPTVQPRTLRLHLDLPAGPNYFRIDLHAWDDTRKYGGFNSCILRRASAHLAQRGQDARPPEIERGEALSK